MPLEMQLKICQKREVCLETDNVILRFFKPSDAGVVAAMAGDERVAATTTNISHPYTFNHAKTWISAQYQQRQTYTALHWAIVEKSSQSVAGAVSIEIILRDGTAHLGYWLGHGYWRKGLGTQAAQAVSSWAMEAGFEKIAARCLSTNRGSIKILERCGFTVEGLLRSHVQRQGSRCDILCYGLLSSGKIIGRSR